MRRRQTGPGSESEGGAGPGGRADPWEVRSTARGGSVGSGEDGKDVSGTRSLCRSPKALQAGVRTAEPDAGRGGSIAWQQGKYPEAELILPQTIALQRRVLNGRDGRGLPTIVSLVRVYTDQSRFAEAESRAKRADGGQTSVPL